MARPISRRAAGCKKLSVRLTYGESKATDALLKRVGWDVCTVARYNRMPASSVIQPLLPNRTYLPIRITQRTNVCRIRTRAVACVGRFASSSSPVSWWPMKFRRTNARRVCWSSVMEIRMLNAVLSCMVLAALCASTATFAQGGGNGNGGSGGGGAHGGATAGMTYHSEPVSSSWGGMQGNNVGRNRNTTEKGMNNLLPDNSAKPANTGQ
jgi:hypothetical protein